MRERVPDSTPPPTDESGERAVLKIAISRGKPTTFSVPKRTGPWYSRIGCSFPMPLLKATSQYTDELSTTARMRPQAMQPAHGERMYEGVRSANGRTR